MSPQDPRPKSWSESPNLTPHTSACSTNPLPGAFAEYITAPRDLVWRVPDAMSLEEAATVSLCGLTAAQSLFYRLGLPAPFGWQQEGSQACERAASKAGTTPINVFIYGASTSVGLFAAKLLRLSSRETGCSYHLLGAASAARHGMLQEAPYGYDGLVDYRAADWVEQVRAQCAATGGVAFALDCIFEGSSVGMVSRVLGEEGRFAVVRSRAGKAWGGEVPVEPVYGAVWEGLGERVEYQGTYHPFSPLHTFSCAKKKLGFVVEASAAARAFAVDFYTFLSRDAVSPQLQGNPVRLMPGGLSKVVEDGFALLGPGSMQDRATKRTEEWMRSVSGEKLIYTLG